MYKVSNGYCNLFTFRRLTACQWMGIGVCEVVIMIKVWRMKKNSRVSFYFKNLENWNMQTKAANDEFQHDYMFCSVCS